MLSAKKMAKVRIEFFGGGGSAVVTASDSDAIAPNSNPALFTGWMNICL